MNETFALIGIVLSIVFGIPAIVTWLKKYPTEIIFIQQEVDNLHNKFVKNIDGLKIYYKGDQINELIYIVRGFLLCKGKRDITKHYIEKPIRLCLPKNSRWLEYKLIQTSDDLDIILKSNNNELEFSFNLLKDNDYAYFQGLFEASGVKKLSELINVKHRIADIGTIKKVKLSTYENPFKYILSSFALGLILLFMAFAVNNNFSLNNAEFKTTYFKNGVEDKSFRHETSLTEQVIKDYNYFQLMFNIRTKEYMVTENLTVTFTLSNVAGQIFGLLLVLISMVYFFDLYNYLSNYLRYKSLFQLMKRTIESEELSKNK